MAVHVAYITPTPVLNGVVLDKNKATIAQMMKADTEMRIVPDSTISTTSDSPPIDVYLQREDANGFKCKCIQNTMVITES